ncbi:hypothetical protein AN219_02930 [Streptomyces nanshensis]|nr:hypothetical protein AN219_02930 [Streptomyces nanshensis]
MGLLAIDEIQANAILEMQLRRLAALERQKITAEHDELQLCGVWRPWSGRRSPPSTTICRRRSTSTRRSWLRRTVSGRSSVRN